jgi:hypothetical protein
MEKILKSKWDGLSKHLIASFWEVDRKNKRLDPDVTVQAPILDGNFEATLNWQSPFEQSGPESKAPALLAMIQTGELQSIIDATPDALGELKTGSSDFLQSVSGRTGITKLNSVQVFTGMPPVKIPVTLLFRAWNNTIIEVENPFNQLMKWALPVDLAEDGSRVVSLARGKNFIDATLPSVSPTMIAMQYKNRIYSPLVIESISWSLTAPIDRDGDYIEATVPMTLATLTAIDRNDWENIVP